MGSSVTAKCECGVHSEIMIGGGMSNHLKVCLFPCFCEKCRDIVEVNLFAKPAQCPECTDTNVIPYDDPRLIGSLGKSNVVEWNVAHTFGRDLMLTDGNYKCPKCGKMTLTFDHGDLLWD
jgi:predicted RNA-binding Zn-ribbon protein involved in translation (DUF1610 family)